MWNNGDVQRVGLAGCFRFILGNGRTLGLAWMGIVSIDDPHIRYEIAEEAVPAVSALGNGTPFVLAPSPRGGLYW